MNSLDLCDFTDPVISKQLSASSSVETSSSATVSASMEVTTQPSLNDEVTQVMDQLGKFWGGVRKQSQTAFESARKDLGQVVSQAQRELEKLGQHPPAPRREEPPVSTKISDEKAADRGDRVLEVASESSIAGPSTESTPSTSNFFSRLQSSLPPNFTPTALSTTLQHHLPENLQHGLNLENATADFTQLRAALAQNIQRVQQGTTIQQAEKLAEQYMHKGEVLLKEAGEFLKDAVKVVPPEGHEAAGLVWDGTDVWPMPSSLRTNLGQGSSKKGKNKESDVIFSVPRGVKRADILLKKLRSDPEALRKDPGEDDDVAIKQLWSSFLTNEVDSKGGITAESWKARISLALEGHSGNEDARALALTKDQLVPAELSNDVFWTRYFFRVHQIEHEEERRKALLEGANQDDDDFTWEDDEEAQGGEGQFSSSQAENVTPVNTSSSTVNRQLQSSPDFAEPTAAPSNAPSSTSQTPVCISPRESEDSYDVVSSGNASGNASGNVSSTGGRTGEKKTKGREKGEEDGDESDWE